MVQGVVQGGDGQFCSLLGFQVLVKNVFGEFVYDDSQVVLLVSDFEVGDIVNLYLVDFVDLQGLDVVGYG